MEHPKKAAFPFVLYPIASKRTTPGLLLFSDAGSGAIRVPFPAVWYNAAEICPCANAMDKSKSLYLRLANAHAFCHAYNVPNPFPAPDGFNQSSETANTFAAADDDDNIPFSNKSIQYSA